MRPPPISTLFPYTTLFRSLPLGDQVVEQDVEPGESLPLRLVAADAVQQVEHRVLPVPGVRSEEHTSELQSRRDLVCRLLLEKRKYDATAVTFGGVSTRFCA